MIVDLAKARVSKEMDDYRLFTAKCLRDEAQMLKDNLDIIPMADELGLRFILEEYRTKLRLENILTATRANDKALGKEFLAEHIHQTMLFTHLAAMDLGVDMKEVMREAKDLPEKFI